MCVGTAVLYTGRLSLLTIRLVIMCNVLLPCGFVNKMHPWVVAFPVYVPIKYEFGFEPDNDGILIPLGYMLRSALRYRPVS